MEYLLVAVGKPVMPAHLTILADNINRSGIEGISARSWPSRTAESVDMFSVTSDLNMEEVAEKLAESRILSSNPGEGRRWTLVPLI